MELAELSSSSNRLISKMAAEDLATLIPFLERVDMPARMQVERRNSRFEEVYFIERGIASVIAVTSQDRRLEVAIIGREGMTGTSALLGAPRSINETFMQVAGEGLRMSVAAFADRALLGEALRARLSCYVQALMAQMSQTALANGRAQVEERLARWLLMAHDRTTGDEIELTHDALSLMLGARRASITLAIHALEGEGLIKATRGLITILDRPALEGYANGLYGLAESEYERLLG